MGATESTTDGTSAGDSSSSSSSAETTAGVDGFGCDCIVDDPGEGVAAPSAPTCGEPLCPGVVAACADLCVDVYYNPAGDPPNFELSDPAALECALTALRDRTPGVITWSLSESYGQFTDVGYILISEDGSAIWRRWGARDLVFVVSAANLGELVASAEYDECLAEPDDLTRFKCMGQVLASVSSACDEGWESEDL